MFEHLALLGKPGHGRTPAQQSANSVSIQVPSSLLRDTEHVLSAG
jgi:hypothetical protein